MSEFVDRWAPLSWHFVVRRALRSARAQVDDPGPGRTVARWVGADAAAAELDEAMAWAAATVGLDQPLGWTLLDLRDVLTSHLVAARAVADASADHDAARRLLRRGIEEVASGMAPLLSPPVVSLRSLSAPDGR